MEETFTYRKSNLMSILSDEIKEQKKYEKEVELMDCDSAYVAGMILFLDALKAEKKIVLI